MITEENSVQFLRLNTGEDLISEVTEIKSDDNTYYILHNPMKLVYQINGMKGSMSISLMQWVFFRICENQEFVLYPNDVVTMNKTADEMEDFYWQSVEHFQVSREKIEKNTHYEEDVVKDQNDLLSEIQELFKTTNKRKLN